MRLPIPVRSNSQGGLSSNDGNLFMTLAIRTILALLCISLCSSTICAGAQSPGRPENLMAGLDIYNLPERARLIAKFGRPESSAEIVADESFRDTWRIGHCVLTLSVPKPGAPSFIRVIILEGDSQCHLSTGKKIKIGSSLSAVAKAYKLTVASLQNDLGPGMGIEIHFNDTTTLVLFFTADRVVKSLRLFSSD